MLSIISLVIVPTRVRSSGLALVSQNQGVQVLWMEKNYDGRAFTPYWGNNNSAPIKWRIQGQKNLLLLSIRAGKEKPIAS